MTLNGFRKECVQFQTSIRVHETFPIFQELVALFLSEEQRNGDLAVGSSQIVNPKPKLGQGQR